MAKCAESDELIPTYCKSAIKVMCDLDFGNTQIQNTADRNEVVVVDSDFKQFGTRRLEKAETR